MSLCPASRAMESAVLPSCKQKDKPGFLKGLDSRKYKTLSGHCCIPPQPATESCRERVKRWGPRTGRRRKPAPALKRSAAKITPSTLCLPTGAAG